MASKKEVEEDVTAIFGLQCKLTKKMLESLDGLDGEELLEKLGAPMLSAISKFLKDQELRIKLSDDESANELGSKLDDIVDNLKESKVLKFAQ